MGNKQTREANREWKEHQRQKKELFILRQKNQGVDECLGCGRPRGGWPPGVYHICAICNVCGH